MPLYHNPPAFSRRFRLIQTSFLQNDGLPFAKVPPEERIEQAFAEAGAKFAQEDDDVYTPAMTLWASLGQALHIPSPTHSSRAWAFRCCGWSVLLSLATAMVCGMAWGPYAGKETGEAALFRKLLEGVDPRTIFLADRCYRGYFLIALAILGRCDFVVRLHQCRKTDFR